MLTFDQAKKTALDYYDEYNYCTETKSAYVFSKLNDKSFGIQPLAVLKNGNEPMVMCAYLDSDYDTDTIKEFSI